MVRVVLTYGPTSPRLRADLSRSELSGTPSDIYKFDTNERVGVFLARRSVQHLVVIHKYSMKIL